jgi:hypothetical protein
MTDSVARTRGMWRPYRFPSGKPLVSDLSPCSPEHGNEFNRVGEMMDQIATFAADRGQEIDLASMDSLHQCQKLLTIPKSRCHEQSASSLFSCFQRARMDCRMMSK